MSTSSGRLIIASIMENGKAEGRLESELAQRRAEVTELRQRLDGLEEAEGKARETEGKLRKGIIEYEKLAALGRLTANVAHEIRNPITVIGGLAERLKKSPSLEGGEKEDLEMITAEAKRLEDILRDVLIFSEKTFLHRDKCNAGAINKMIDDSLAAYEDVCKARSIDIRRVFQEIAVLYVDRRYLKEALSNLISNAMEAMPQGGTLTVSLDETIVNGKGYASITVADTGAGIAKEQMGMIFEPFFSTKVTKAETGLGLPIARKMVEAHGGFIKVDSEPGKGSTFGLYFPYRGRQ